MEKNRLGNNMNHMAFWGEELGVIHHTLVKELYLNIIKFMKVVLSQYSLLLLLSS